MPAETPRILELRRRVQSDPSSIAFAQLAEEHRRVGNYDEAIKCCRTGLTRHPGYLSARVTLGRALMETGGLDEAAREFELVLRSAPDNLAAIRGMAEIHQQTGALEPALDYYKRALALARHDPELAETVSQIARELGTVTSPSRAAGMSFAEAHSELLSAASRMPEQQRQPMAPAPEAAADTPEPTPTPPPSALVDFDALLQSLGVPDAAPPPSMARLLTGSASPGVSSLPAAELPPEVQPPADDPFAELERALRAFDGARAAPTPAAAPTTAASTWTPTAGSAPTSTPAPATAPAPTPTPTEAPTLPPPPPEPAISTATTSILDELEAWLSALTPDRARREQAGSSWQNPAGGERRPS